VGVVSCGVLFAGPCWADVVGSWDSGVGASEVVVFEASAGGTVSGVWSKGGE
jgi:hypothetical protein